MITLPSLRDLLHLTPLPDYHCGAKYLLRSVYESDLRRYRDAWKRGRRIGKRPHEWHYIDEPIDMGDDVIQVMECLRCGARAFPATFSEHPSFEWCEPKPKESKENE